MALCTSPSMHRPTNPGPFATLHRQSLLSLVYLSKVSEFVEVICGDMTANAPWRRHIKIASNVSAIDCRTQPSQSASEERDQWRYHVALAPSDECRADMRMRADADLNCHTKYRLAPAAATCYLVIWSDELVGDCVAVLVRDATWTIAIADNNSSLYIYT